MMSKLDELQKLYKEIHKCTNCHNFRDCEIQYDPMRKERLAIEDTLSSRIFLVGQALGRKTQRQSGIPYREPDFEELSAAGKKLEKHLRPLGYCLPHWGSDIDQMVYSSDIVQCWPGLQRFGDRDRSPNHYECSNCFPWLEQELRLLRPLVVVLLGKIAAGGFFKRYLDRKFERLRDVLNEEYSMNIDGLAVYSYVLPHPAAREKSESIYTYTFNKVRDRLDAGG